MDKTQPLLITGGAGFVGGHVAARLAAAGTPVVICDSLITGDPENVPKGAQLHVMDMTSPEFVELVRWLRPRALVHLAAQVSVGQSVQDPLYDAKVNVLGTLNVLEAAREAGVPHLIFASSAAVYGSPICLPVKEDHPLLPRSPYGAAKLAAEQYIRAYADLYGLRAVVTRYANVFGPRQRAGGDGGVVAAFVDAALGHRPPVFYGDGKQTRDFVYVGDVARATEKALSYLKSAPRGTFLPVNVGSGKETSLQDLYREIRAQVPGALAPRFADPRPGDIRHSRLDATQAEKTLSWTAETTLTGGIQKTIAAWKDAWKSRRARAGGEGPW